MSMLGLLAARLATGGQDRLLSLALSMEGPGLLPPDPFLRFGVACRFAMDRAKAGAEL